MNTSKESGTGARWVAGVARWGMALPLLLAFTVWSNAQPPDRKGAPPPPPDKAAEGPTKTVRGLVKEFTTAPKGETDGFILDEGTEVHFPPHLSDKVMDVVNKKDRVKVTGRSMKMPGGETHFQATSITNLRTNASVDITDDAPPPPPPEGRIAPPPPDRRGGPDRPADVDQRLKRLEEKMDRLLEEMKRLKRDKD